MNASQHIISPLAHIAIAGDDNCVPALSDVYYKTTFRGVIAYHGPSAQRPVRLHSGRLPPPSPRPNPPPYTSR